MTPEQIEELKKALAQTKAACEEAETMTSDYDKCESEISRKYLSAAIKKHAASIMQSWPSDLFAQA